MIVSVFVSRVFLFSSLRRAFFPCCIYIFFPPLPLVSPFRCEEWSPLAALQKSYRSAVVYGGTPPPLLFTSCARSRTMMPFGGELRLPLDGCLANRVGRPYLRLLLTDTTLTPDLTLLCILTPRRT